jgi:DNA-binding MarR family transcriptional regulator
MKEVQLHEILITNPHLIEDGCIFLESEVNLNGKRCDLLFLDAEGRKLYVEVKLKVDDRAVGQLIRYEGLANNPDARFMLVGLSFVAGLKEGLKKYGFEYKEINLESVNENTGNVTLYQKKVTRNKSKFETVEQLIATFNSQEQKIAREIFNYAYSLDGVYYYLSDGIMFRRATRRYKFLSISTVGNRLLFHVPIKRRDVIFNQFKDKLKIYIPVDPRDKNQIDIDLKNIDSLESVKELIDLAYKERE